MSRSHSEARPVGAGDAGRELSVVVPTVGRAVLERCLASLAGGTVRPAVVLVVDQGDAATTAPIVERARSRGLRAERVASAGTGRARGVNRGLELLATPFVAITDDDCVVAPGWAAALLERLGRHPGCVITGRVVPEEGDLGTMSLALSDRETIHRRPRLAGDVLMGGNMALPGAVIETIGGLDEDPVLASAEDCEWCYRMLRAGIPIVYAPEASVTHVGWRSAEQRAARWDDYARSIGGFYGKYRDPFLATRALLDVLRGARRWIRGTVRGDPDMAASGRAYVTALVPGVLAGLRRRR